MIEFLKSLEVVYFLTVAFCPSANQGYTIPGDRNGYWYELRNYTQTELELEVRTPRKYFFAGGSIENQCKYSKKIFFKPIENTYKFQIGSNIGKIQMGYEHTCTHPIGNLVKHGVDLGDRYGNTNKIYFRVGGSR